MEREKHCALGRFACSLLFSFAISPFLFLSLSLSSSRASVLFVSSVCAVLSTIFDAQMLIRRTHFVSSRLIFIRFLPLSLSFFCSAFDSLKRIHNVLAMSLTLWFVDFSFDIDAFKRFMLSFLKSNSNYSTVCTTQSNPIQSNQWVSQNFFKLCIQFNPSNLVLFRKILQLFHHSTIQTALELGLKIVDGWKLAWFDCQFLQLYTTPTASSIWNIQLNLMQ